MRPSQSLLTLIIKLIILMIFFVCLCFISAFLYSTKYWPDIYNYINANITIERIPTISELKIQIVEVGYDYTTEVYSTTDADYFELSTVDDFDIDEFMTTNFNAKTRVKRNAILEEIEDYKELPSRPIFLDYIFLEEPIEIKNQENNTEDDVIMRTFITKTVIDNLTELIEDRESDDHTSIHKSNIEEPNRKLMNINIGTESDRNEKYLVKGVREYLLQLTTTVEGYLVGEEIEGEVNNRPNEEPLHMTTDNNENEHDEETNFNLLKDLADVSKLTTRSPEDVEMVSEISDTGHHDTTFKETVFPWVATIFIKNLTDNSQFQNYCDGALLSEKVILTGGRCVHHGNGPVPPEDILVFLGKGNLQSMGGKEKLHRIKNVIVHFSFTTDAKGNTQNDLAILIMEESATFNDRIQSSCIHFDEAAEIQEAATTAWGQNGQLLPIAFEKEKSDICFDKNEDIFCATYGPAVPLCPSYGGVYVAKRGTKWCLEGIFYGDPAYRGLCINKNVLYTSLRNYFDWIDGYIMFNTNKLN